MAEDVHFVDDSDRYGRLRLISWWSQEKVRAARVLVVGAGALGNEVLKNLALLGVGRVVIVDRDRVEPSNLSRSVLYRSADAGRPKSEAAAEAVRALNPDVKARAVHGDVMTKVGLGTFGEMDVVIGCLDNREARLWVNRQCWKMGRPWVDGAIQEISGTVKVFVPPDGACYECGMTEADYRWIDQRYSCPLLRREDLAEGKVPTTPTIASIIAGLQTQEALKLIHGLPVRSGGVLVFNGDSNSFYPTQIVRKEACLSHETYGPVVDVPMGCGGRGEDLLQATQAGRLLLDRDVVVDLTCPRCGAVREVYRPRSEVGEREGRCAACAEEMRPRIVHEVDRGSALAGRTLRELGVAPFDVVRAAAGEKGLYVRLAGDREKSEPGA